MADTPPTPKPSSGGGLSKKVGGIPVWVIGLVGVGVVGGVLYVRHKNAAAAAAASPGAGSAGSADGSGVAAVPSGPSGGGIDSDTIAAILASQGAGSTGSTSASTATTAAAYAAPAGETLVGGGYGLPKGGGATTAIKDAAGYSYQYISTPTQAKAIQSSGQKLYTQPVPGVFIVPTGPNAPGTPEFVRVPG